MKKPGFFIGIMVAFLFLSIIATTNSPVQATEYDTLRDKWKTMLTGGTSYNTSDPDIAARITSITGTAQTNWNNLDKSGGRTYLWSDLASTTISSHLTSSYRRIKEMALAYSTTGSSLKGNTTLKADIVSALDWMYTNRYNTGKSEYDNWWDWEIGVPLQLNDCTALMYGDLTSTQITNYMNSVNKFSPDPTKYASGSTATGANRIWKCLVVGLRGIIVQDSAKITSARDAVSPTFDYVTTGDGFYTDGSFIQHSQFPYTGGYGKSMIKDQADFMYLLNGSTWAVTDTDKQNFFKWIYDSFEPLIYKGAMMDMSRGREIARCTAEDHVVGHATMQGIIRASRFAPSTDSTNYKKMIKYWIESDNFRSFYGDSSIDMIVLGKEIVANSTSRGELIKYKQFSNMDRAVHLRPGFGFAISMHSTRMANYESINSENLKGWHTADGMTYLYNTDLGQFSDNFWPTVNSYRLPGTTVNQSTTYAASKKSDQNWVGGTEIQGIYGVTGMQLHPNGQTLTAKKSWFMFDDEIVCLGTGITSTDNKVVESIVENRKLNSSGNNALTVNGTAKSTVLGWTETMSGVNWVHLAGSVTGSDIGYYFPGTASVKGLRESRTGKWTDINTNSNYSGYTTNYTRNYLTLWFDHGTNPANQGYSYVILPNKTSAQVSGYAGSPNITILENSSSAQAVKENNLKVIGANFWADANKTVDIITCNKKAAVMTRETASDIEVSVSDPTMANTGTIVVEINRNASGAISSDSGVTVNQLSPTIMITVNVNGAKGKAFKAKFQLGSGGSTPTPTPTPSSNPNVTTYNPSADAFVRDGIYAGTNYGTDLSLSIKKDNADYNRKAYLMYDFSSFSGSIKQATLRVNTNGAGTDSTRTIKVYGTTDESWSESGIIWNNAPAGSTYIASFNVNTTTGIWYSVDVTSYVQNHSADKKVSFLLINEGTASAQNFISFSSREASSNKPELAIEKSTATPTPTPTPSSNLALNKTVTCSSQQTGNEATHAVDGDTATRWSAEIYPQWIRVDLGATYGINKTEIAPYLDRAYRYKIEVSTDGTNYTQVVDRTNNTTGGPVLTDTFSTVSARYVRLTVTGAYNYTGTWVSILEFRVFGN